MVPQHFTLEKTEPGSTGSTWLRRDCPPSPHPQTPGTGLTPIFFGCAKKDKVAIVLGDLDGKGDMSRLIILTELSSRSDNSCRIFGSLTLLTPFDRFNFSVFQCASFARRSRELCTRLQLADRIVQRPKILINLSRHSTALTGLFLCAM